MEKRKCVKNLIKANFANKVSFENHDTPIKSMAKSERCLNAALIIMAKCRWRTRWNKGGKNSGDYEGNEEGFVPQNKLHVLECAAKGKSLLLHEKNSLEWKASAKETRLGS